MYKTFKVFFWYFESAIIINSSHTTVQHNIRIYCPYFTPTSYLLLDLTGSSSHLLSLSSGKPLFYLQLLWGWALFRFHIKVSGFLSVPGLFHFTYWPPCPFVAGKWILALMTQDSFLTYSFKDGHLGWFYRLICYK